MLKAISGLRQHEAKPHLPAKVQVQSRTNKISNMFQFKYWWGSFQSHSNISHPITVTTLQGLPYFTTIWFLFLTLKLLKQISNRFPCYLYHKGDIDLPDIRPVKSASPENVAFIGDIVIRKFLYISAFYTCLCYATQQLNHILMWWKLLHRVQLSQNVLSIFISGVICKNPCFLKTPCQITVTFFKESKQSLYILDNSR